MHRTARRTAPLLVAALALLASACGTGTGSAGPAGNAKPAPELSSVTALEDPRAHTGPSTAVIGDSSIRPIAKAPTPKLPVTLTDVQDRKVTVTDTSRILALDVNGTLARTVFELGMGDSVVGRDVSTDFPEAKKLPLVTQQGHDLSAEAILELDPTVIITDTSLGPWDVVQQMRRSGVPVVVVDSHRGVDNVAALIGQVAQALGVDEQGKALTERTEREIAATTAQIKKVAPSSTTGQLRTMFLYARGQSGIYYLFGEGTGAESLIKALGLYDVAKEIGWKGMKPVTDEGLIAAQPDVVLMMSKGLSSAGGVDALLKRMPALAQTPAGQQRRIVDMDDAALLGFGPLTARVLNALAVAIYAPESVA